MHPAGCWTGSYKEKGAISQDSAQKHPGVVREELLLHELT